jgi:hypothetical protein
MREVIFGTILVGAAGLGVYFLPAGTFGGSSGPDYPLTVKEAKMLLAQADLREGKVPFGRLEVQVTSPQTNEVRWQAGGSMAAIDCSARLTPVGDKGVDVTTACTRSGVGDGAAAATSEDITELGFAEFVAAALGKRKFDDAKVNAQASGAVFKNLGQMQRDALKMQRDVQQDIDSAEAANDADEAAGDDGDTSDYGGEY